MQEELIHLSTILAIASGQSPIVIFEWDKDCEDERDEFLRQAEIQYDIIPGCTITIRSRPLRCVETNYPARVGGGNISLVPVPQSAPRRFGSKSEAVEWWKQQLESHGVELKTAEYSRPSPVTTEDRYTSFDSYLDEDDEYNEIFA